MPGTGATRPRVLHSRQRSPVSQMHNLSGVGAVIGGLLVAMVIANPALADVSLHAAGGAAKWVVITAVVLQPQILPAS